MELNQGEFDTLTKKLEQYAAQLSTLQTKLELQPEIVSLRDQLASVQHKLDEVTAERSEVYNHGRQKGTAFNRDFVARIIHMMSMKGVVSGSDSRLTELLEPEKGKSHPVRGSLGLVPERNVKRAVEGVFQKYELKVSES